MMALWSSMLHHFGSFALGGLMLGLLRPLRACAWTLRRTGLLLGRPMGEQDKYSAADYKSSQGKLQKTAEALMQNLSLSGYVEMAITSTSFVDSMKASTKRRTQPGVASALGGSTILPGCWGAAAAGCCSSLTLCVTLISLSTFNGDNSSLFVASPVFASMILLVIASLTVAPLFAMYDMAAESLLYCYLIESTTTDGSMNEDPDTKQLAPDAIRELVSEFMASEPEVAYYDEP
eukprot:GHVU01138124.1.p1 GENE.GHVU01138124.1~~GHVU01138124.1.p1  ORF type:complete len:234 (-),score=48.99 GHVU01138124.1:680-1381(-)